MDSWVLKKTPSGLQVLEKSHSGWCVSFKTHITQALWATLRNRVTLRNREDEAFIRFYKVSAHLWLHPMGSMSIEKEFYMSIEKGLHYFYFTTLDIYLQTSMSLGCIIYAYLPAITRLRCRISAYAQQIWVWSCMHIHEQSWGWDAESMRRQKQILIWDASSFHIHEQLWGWNVESTHIY